MSKKALVIIDANGKYDKDNGCHSTNVSANVDQDFYSILINEIVTGDYQEILYNINLPNCTEKSEIDRAIELDPVLSKLDDETIKKVKVFRGGFQLAKEFDNHSECIMLENSLAEQNYDFVVAGLYYDWCVKAHAENLQSRYPNVNIQRPEYLSRWSSERAKYDRDNRIGTEQIGRRTQRRFGMETVGIVEVFEPNLDLPRKIRGVGKDD